MVSNQSSVISEVLFNINSKIRTFCLITDYWLLITFFLMAPLYAQDFDSLLTELSGSNADQLESESTTEKKKIPPSLSSADIASLSEKDELAPEKNIITNGVTLQGLDKPTARVFIIDAAIGQTIEFGTLKIVIQHCEKAPLENRQESMAFVKIMETKPNCPSQQLFSGWMFSSSPALSSLDHPMYDVWIKECKELKKDVKSSSK